MTTDNPPTIYPPVGDAAPMLDPKASYYNAGGIAVIDAIRAKLTPDQYRGWLLGQVLRYCLRCNFKHDTPKRDVEKALVYLRLLDEELDNAGA